MLTVELASITNHYVYSRQSQPDSRCANPSDNSSGPRHLWRFRIYSRCIRDDTFGCAENYSSGQLRHLPGTDRGGVFSAALQTPLRLYLPVILVTAPARVSAMQDPSEVYSSVPKGYGQGRFGKFSQRLLEELNLTS